MEVSPVNVRDLALINFFKESWFQLTVIHKFYLWRDAGLQHISNPHTDKLFNWRNTRWMHMLYLLPSIFVYKRINNLPHCHKDAGSMHMELYLCKPFWVIFLHSRNFRQAIQIPLKSAIEKWSVVELNTWKMDKLARYPWIC